tara:strand:+ start:3514 stop:4533 length:1020 start_codon:yes stop_codon:yes gene_type:complete
LRETITFDDVLLVPKYSNILSRKQIDLSVSLGERGIVLDCPFISSPMDTVTEFEMAIAMAKSGGLGVIHRYNTIEEQANIAKGTTLKTEKVAAAIGVSGDYLDRATALYECGIRIICIDVAHGHHSLMKKALSDIRNIFSDSIHIMAGNVATLEGFNDLSDWGADSIRVGIGGGSICSTRIQTGHGVPTLQSVLDCSVTDRDALIIADGGMKSTGDIAKAIAAGADLVMCGSMFAGTEESPGDVFSAPGGKKYKAYRGMASVEAQRDWKGSHNSVEGISTTIPYKGNVSDIIELMKKQLTSSCSYSGARNLKEFMNNKEFIIQSSSSQLESSTHILNKR